MNENGQIMTVTQTIREAELLLPGEPAPEGEEDPRWQAIIEVAEYIPTEPQAVWRFIEKWGAHPQEDLRMAVACCLLEHLLEQHFAEFFPRTRKLALSNPLFADTFVRCWKFGQSEWAGNAREFNGLKQQLETLDRGRR